MSIVLGVSGPEDGEAHAVPPLPQKGLARRPQWVESRHPGGGRGRSRAGMRLSLTINGEPRDLVLEDATVAGLLASLGLPRHRVAVEVDGDLVRREQHGDRPLSGGERIEIVTLVGGG